MSVENVEKVVHPTRGRRKARIVDTRKPSKLGPAIEIDLRAVEWAASLMCTPEDASGYFEVSRATFYRMLAEEAPVKGAWERGKAKGRVSLRRIQFKLAQTSAGMAIFLGKQYLGQRDVVGHEVTGADGGPVEQTVIHKTWHELVESALKPRVPTTNGAEPPGD